MGINMRFLMNPFSEYSNSRTTHKIGAIRQKTELMKNPKDAKRYVGILTRHGYDAHSLGSRVFYAKRR